MSVYKIYLWINVCGKYTERQNLIDKMSANKIRFDKMNFNILTFD